MNCPEFQTTHGYNASSAPTVSTVSALYRDLLHRDPDANGLEYWVNRGLNMYQIVNCFLSSGEFQKTIGNSLSDGVFYKPYLG
jgi:hypothetical protein